MSLQSLLGDLAVNLAAGFADELANSIKRDVAGVVSHPHARSIGRQLAHAMLDDDGHAAIQGELIDREPPSESELIEGQLAVWKHPVTMTPELMAAYLDYAKERELE